MKQADWSFLNPITIKTLVLDGAIVDTDRLAKHIANCRLERLELNDVEVVTSTFVDAIAQLPPSELHYLGLAGGEIGDDDVAQLRDHEFSELNLSRTQITDDCVESLLFCLRHGALELKLAGTDLSDKGVSQLSSIRVGRLLDLSETNITGEAFRGWKQFPAHLNLSKTKVGDELIETLLKAPAIDRINEEKGMRLDLSHTQITDAVLLPLNKQLLGDCSVDVSHTSITAGGLTELAKQPNVSRLDWYIEKERFTEQQLAALRDAGTSITELEGSE